MSGNFHIMQTIRLAIAGTLALCIVAQGAGTPGIAVVVKVKGAVEIQPPDTAAWNAATAGQVLRANSRLRTGADGLAMVKFLADGSMVRLKPATNLLISLRQDKVRETEVSMGMARFDIAKQEAASRYLVKTPTCVATVKGTVFWVAVSADSSSKITCTEGILGIKSANGRDEKELDAGYTLLADRKGILTIRKSAAADLPDGEQGNIMEINFKDKNGNTRTLHLEYNELR